MILKVWNTQNTANLQLASTHQITFSSSCWTSHSFFCNSRWTTSALPSLHQSKTDFCSSDIGGSSDVCSVLTATPKPVFAFSSPTAISLHTNKDTSQWLEQGLGYKAKDLSSKAKDSHPSLTLPSVQWRCWLGDRKGIRPVKNWVVGCRHGCLSGARCRLAYGPADAAATQCLLLQ